ncbi:uncharacterized protein L201_006852 [Kwoniella dendrophila CBS 6074]|uniref:Uncharacterized protein n=1 Tax=Kwoniella dendrophila CBS 6074 TaxID=1295534 RepID=A0AAX4K582_9TREE
MSANTGSSRSTQLARGTIPSTLGPNLMYTYSQKSSVKTAHRTDIDWRDARKPPSTYMSKVRSQYGLPPLLYIWSDDKRSDETYNAYFSRTEGDEAINSKIEALEKLVELNEERMSARENGFEASDEMQATVENDNKLFQSEGLPLDKEEVVKYFMVWEDQKSTLEENAII